jgi:DNA modification methylase
MKPYYQDEYVTIYNADCLEILSMLPEVDLVLTDPPYGIGRDTQKISSSKHGGRKNHEKLSNWDSDPVSIDLLIEIQKKAKDSIVWGANYFPKAFNSSMGWLVWDKGQNICSSDCELAYSSRIGALRRIVINRVELMKDGTEHPTQKPLKLMVWCLNFFPDADLILDPFMGSGTTLRAAKDLNRKAIGIELEEKYCEIAAKRMQQMVLELGV